MKSSWRFLRTEPAGPLAARALRVVVRAVLPAALMASVLPAVLSCRLDMRYDKYAVVFGVEDYLNVNDLGWSADDATAMAALLEGQGYVVQGPSGPGSGPFVDWDATAANLQTALSQIASVADEDALFVFYFSGHGGQSVDPSGAEGSSADDPYGEFIALYDAPVDLDPAASGILTEDELAAALRVLPCRMKIVIIDACNSGGFIGDSADVDGVPSIYTGTVHGPLTEIGSAISLYLGGADPRADITPGEAIVLSAAGEREFSYEAPPPATMDFQHGIFTYFLLQAPLEGDANGDGYVTVTEAYDYTRRKIDQNWNALVYSVNRFAPHVSGGPVDYVLFSAP